MAASPRPLVPEPDPRRVVGVDVARALALLGMMATHMLPGRIGFDVPWPQQLACGRASALFAVLAGVSVALVSGRERPVRGRQRDAAGMRLAVRALLIGVVGLGLGTLDSGIAVILTYYAVLFVIGLPFLGLGAGRLAALAAGWVLAAPVASQLLRPHLPERGFGSPVPGDLGHPWQLATELTFTGYYPTFVWLAYLLAGMAIGRCRLSSARTACGLLISGVALAVAATFVSHWLTSRAGVHSALARTYPDAAAADPRELDALLTHGLRGTTPTGSWWWLSTVAPHSGTPPDLAQTVGTAMAVIGACLLATRAQRGLWATTFGAGAMTLTLYSLHVGLMARGHWPHLQPPGHYGEQVLLVLATGATFALVPLRGPLESLVGRVSTGAAAMVTAVRQGRHAAYHSPT
jgi:uncharacterized membrane protein